MTTDERMQDFAKAHREQCDSETEAIIFRADRRPGGRRPGDRDFLQQQCLHCHAVIELPINDGELVGVEMDADGLPVFQLVAPA